MQSIFDQADENLDKLKALVAESSQTIKEMVEMFDTYAKNLKEEADRYEAEFNRLKKETEK